MHHQAADEQLVLHDDHHHRAVARGEGAVHNDLVAVRNARAGHGSAGDAHDEGAGAVPDQVLVQVDPAVKIVLGWGREPAGSHVGRRRCHKVHAKHNATT